MSPQFLEVHELLDDADGPAPLLVNRALILTVTPRDDGGADLTLAEPLEDGSDVLHVLESYSTLKGCLLAPEGALVWPIQPHRN